MKTRHSLFVGVAGALWACMAWCGSPAVPADDARLSTFKDITAPAEIDAERLDLQKSLLRFGVNARLTSCKLMIQLTPDSRDRSYGAICKFQSGTGQGSGGGRDVMICDDTLIGKFTIKFSFAETAKSLAYFTQVNCPSGG